MLLCRVCGMAGERCLTPLWPDLPAHRGRWSHCWICGSDVSDTDYDTIRNAYNADYVEHNVREIGFEGCIREVQTNVWYFQKHEQLCPERTFLDIGCLEGSGMAAMAERSWAVHGFDIIPAAKLRNPPGEHITIADQFRASLFPRQYAAVMAREVIEHVPNWMEFLSECHAATLPGGLFQVQTPRPVPEPVGHVYFADHLQIFAPFVLRRSLQEVGFEIKDWKLWETGQLWQCRRPISKSP